MKEDMKQIIKDKSHVIKQIKTKKAMEIRATSNDRYMTLVDKISKIEDILDDTESKIPESP